MDQSRDPVEMHPDKTQASPDPSSNGMSPVVPATPGNNWRWEPPDLGPKSAFYLRQAARLQEVVCELNGPEEWIAEDEDILTRHRDNYGADGPQQLVVLWWNWPPEHWAELRDGASMNFLQEPEPGLVENLVMTAEQLETATGFVDELIDLGVLQKPTEPLQNNFPLFLFKKSVKGQWRCIANGMSGGQNDNCTGPPGHSP
jgi:hypothetical protein